MMISIHHLNIIDHISYAFGKYPFAAYEAATLPPARAARTLPICKHPAAPLIVAPN
jgi:hypothetical protein